MAMGDQIVSYSLAEKAMTELAPRIASTAGEGWFEFLPFEGDHEFCPDDGPIRALAADLGL